MNISTTPFNVLSVDRDKGEVHLGMSEARPIPQDIECGQTVYLSTDKPACPRTSDMQDLVDRCEAKAKPPEKGWRKVMHNDIAYIVDENDKGVAMIPATWWLIGQTDEERAAELRQRRENYFTNVPLVLNAKRMFDLLEELAFSSNPFGQPLGRARDLIRQIKTQQWKPEHPTQG